MNIPVTVWVMPCMKVLRSRILGFAGRGMALKVGMTIAIEPMLLVGTPDTRVLPDQWTVSSADGSLTAHFEHTVAITENGPLILTTLGEGKPTGRNNKEQV